MPKIEIAKDELRPLAQLKTGERARIMQLDLHGLERRRLMDLGFTPGAEIEVAMRAAFGGPIAFRIRNTKIALRKQQAEKIWVQPLSKNEHRKER